MLRTVGSAEQRFLAFQNDPQAGNELSEHAATFMLATLIGDGLLIVE